MNGNMLKVKRKKEERSQFAVILFAAELDRTAIMSFVFFQKGLRFHRLEMESLKEMKI